MTKMKTSIDPKRVKQQVSSSLYAVFTYTTESDDVDKVLVIIDKYEACRRIQTGSEYNDWPEIVQGKLIIERNDSMIMKNAFNLELVKDKAEGFEVPMGPEYNLAIVTYTTDDGILASSMRFSVPLSELAPVYSDQVLSLVGYLGYSLATRVEHFNEKVSDSSIH
jgi:hypothetical protein